MAACEALVFAARGACLVPGAPSVASVGAGVMDLLRALAVHLALERLFDPSDEGPFSAAVSAAA